VSGAFAAVDLIRIKRDGGTLSGDQIDWLIDAYTRGDVHEEQMAAMAMAIYFQGLTEPELVRWT
jgi:thymidine phosphorylase